MSAPWDGAAVVDSGVEDDIEWATVRAPMYGAVNGYARVPEGHPWFGLGYDASELDVDVHGGLTYGANKDGWLGFDFLHYGDIWPDMPMAFRSMGGRERTADEVADEARKLARLIAEASS